MKFRGRNRIVLLMVVVGILPLLSCKEGQYFKKLVRETGEAPSVEWHKTYPGKASSIVENEDGSFTVVGRNDQYKGNDSLFLMKVDKDGDLLWKEYYTQDGFSIILEPLVSKTLDSGYLVTIGYGRGWDSPTCYILKYDSLGELLWEREFPGILWFAYQAEKGVYRAVYSKDENVSFIEMDSDGNEVLKIASEDTISFLAKTFCPTYGGSFVVVGGVQKPGAMLNRSYVRKIGKNGRIIWTTDIGDSTYWFDMYHNSVQQTADSGFLVIGHKIHVDSPFEVDAFKLDNNGNRLWHKSYGDTRWPTFGYFSRMTENGQSILLGTTSSMHSRYFCIPRMIEKPLWTIGLRIPFLSHFMKVHGIGFFDDLYLIKVDEVGNEIWAKKFGRINSSSLSDIATYTSNPKMEESFSFEICSDGGLAIIGYSITMFDFPKDCFHLFKLSGQP